MLLMFPPMTSTSSIVFCGFLLLQTSGLQMLDVIKTKPTMCGMEAEMPACDSTPWRPLPGAKATEICVKGRALPKLYVLGAQKSSTSSLATDLSCTGIQPIAGTDDKEFHFFDGKSEWHGDDVEYENWLDRMPYCGKGAHIRGKETEYARLVADFTPNNLRMVRGETTYNGLKVNVPQTLKKWYGDQAGELTLVLMVREPLARMQSAWYAAQLCGYFKAICKDDCKAPTFQEALTNVLNNATKEEPILTEWIWTSMYGRHLEQWMEQFLARQIMVVPYKEYSNGNADHVCKELSNMTQFPMDCNSKGAGVTHLWASGHKELSEDMTDKLTAKFKSVMDAEDERFIRALTMGQRQGLRLANYKGKRGDEDDIRAWLKAGW